MLMHVARQDAAQQVCWLVMATLCMHKEVPRKCLVVSSLLMCCGGTAAAAGRRSLETVLENVSDPNHVNFVHHKVQGARQMEKGRGTIASSEPLSRAGFVCQRTQEGRDFVFTFAFQAPYTIKYVLGGRAFAVLAVPLRAGWTRVFTRFLRRKGARAGNLLFAVVGMVEKMRLLEHALLRNSVLDGDNYMLHVQVGGGMEQAASSHMWLPGVLCRCSAAEGLGRDLN